MNPPESNPPLFLSSIPRVLPPAGDRAHEPALEGMANNAAYHWLLDKNWGRLLSDAGRRLLVLPGALFMCAAPMLASHPATLRTMFAVFLVWGVCAIFVWVRDRYQRGKPDCLFVGRPLRAWAEFADTGHPAEDMARGIWGVRATCSARMDFAIAGLAGLAAIASLAVAPFAESADPRPRGVALLFALFALGFAGYTAAGRFRNPWSALAAARQDVTHQGKRAVGRRGPLWRWLAGEVDHGPGGEDVLPRIVSTVFVTMAIWEVDVIIRHAGGSPMRELAAPACVGALLAGIVLGRREVRRARTNRDFELARLVSELESILDAIRVAIHGPDAVRSSPPPFE